MQHRSLVSSVRWGIHLSTHDRAIDGNAGSQSISGQDMDLEDVHERFLVVNLVLLGYLAPGSCAVSAPDLWEIGVAATEEWEHASRASAATYRSIGQRKAQRAKMMRLLTFQPLCCEHSSRLDCGK